MRVPDFDDIVFEKLNKEYGAYLLRKLYNRAVVVSVALACILGSAMVIIPFIRIPKQNNDKVYTIVSLTMENLGAPGEMAAPPPPPPSSIPPRSNEAVSHAADEVKYMAPVIVDTVITQERKISSNADSSSGVINDTGITGGIGNEMGGFSETGGGSGGMGGTEIYSSVEIMPKFKGGDINKFREWVQKKTIYPEIAMINGIRGKVYISFIVEKDGSVTNVKVVRGVDPLIDDEALVAVKSSPKWTPGRQRGIAVRVSYMIMLDFKL
jgi:periplasmic protein TonB